MREVRIPFCVETDLSLDELIKVHKSSVETSRSADVALARAVEYSQEALRQQHEDFRLVIQTFKEHLQDIETASEKVQSFIEKLMSGLDAGVRTILTRVDTATRSVETDITNLREVRTTT